ERFLREVRIAATLAHPHIVSFIDSGESGGLLYYVMPHIEGESLRARLKREGKLGVVEALTLLRDVASALAYAHASGVIHRDLKPENVLVAGAHAYLLDFGVAKVQSPLLEDTSLTQEGMAVGTVAYMAPEQLEEGHTVDHRADLYAWGLLAHEMLAGRRPDDMSADGGSSGAALRRHRPDIPRGLATLIAACLARDPKSRPSSAEQVTARLGRIAEGAPARAVPTRRLPIAGAAGLAAIAMAAIVLVRRAPDATPLLSAETRLAGPIAVAVLANETGDPALDSWGRMAGDWITQGLQDIGLVPVVPWPSALHASEELERRGAAGEPVNAVALLREESGAGTVVTGSYYLVGDSLAFRVEVADAIAQRVIVAPPPVVVARDSAHVAVRMLRDRLMSAVAIQSDDRFATSRDLASRPPIIEAYRQFDRGIELHLAQEYDAAVPAFLEAHRLDTTFVPPLIYASTDLWNTGQFARLNAVLTILQSRQQRLDPYHRFWAEYIANRRRGEGDRSLAAIRRAAELAPGSRAWYALAQAALETDRPDEALIALERIDPEHGELRGWSSYWTQLTHALHAMGLHERELAAARSLRSRYPDRRVGLVLEARALGALGLADAVDSLVDGAAALPPTTYWSQGAELVVAGEELLSHGYSQEGERLLARGERWLRQQLTVVPDERAHRYWLGSALYDQRKWNDAAGVLVELRRDFPERLQYRGLAALSAARAGDARAEALLGDAAPHERGSTPITAPVSPRSSGTRFERPLSSPTRRGSESTGSRGFTRRPIMICGCWKGCASRFPDHCVSPPPRYHLKARRTVHNEREMGNGKREWRTARPFGNSASVSSLSPVSHFPLPAPRSPLPAPPSRSPQ
ncbi:MAG: protein kinase domain-containing protein, partial [Gemmatimonadaceae bacterium]